MLIRYVKNKNTHSKFVLTRDYKGHLPEIKED